MSLGHLSILLTHYGAFYMHVYRGHGAGTKSQPTQAIKHSSGKHVPGTCNSGKLVFRSHEEGCSRRLLHLCFTPMFCHCNMSRQSSFGRSSCGMLQQGMLQKGRFLSCEQLGSVRLQLYYRFNQSQTTKKRQYNTFMLTYLL